MDCCKPSDDRDESRLHKGPRWLGTVMPLAQFMLQLIVLITFLEIAPSDLPKTCPYEIHSECYGQYVASGGDFEASYFESKCGGLRVDCWRSGIKELLYQGQAIPDGTYSINISSVGLSSEALALYGPNLAFCDCMLTQNGTVPYPSNPYANRFDTGFFCDAIESFNSMVGVGGLVLAVFAVLMKGYTDHGGVDKLGVKKENYEGVDASIIFATLVTTVFWCVWSFYVVDVTGSYRYALGGRQDRARIQPDCEAPDSNTIYYLYVLGWVSAVSSIYGIVITTMVGCVYTNRTVRKQSCWPDL